MVTGIVGWVRVNCGAEIVTLEIAMSVVPLFVAVRLKVLLLATGTLPKSRLNVLVPRLPSAAFWDGGGVDLLPPALKPWHPAITLNAIRTTTACQRTIEVFDLSRVLIRRRTIPGIFRNLRCRYPERPV